MEASDVDPTLLVSFETVTTCATSSSGSSSAPSEESQDLRALASHPPTLVRASFMGCSEMGDVMRVIPARPEPSARSSWQKPTTVSDAWRPSERETTRLSPSSIPHCPATSSPSSAEGASAISAATSASSSQSYSENSLGCRGDTDSSCADGAQSAVST